MDSIKINAPPGCGKTYTMMQKYTILVNTGEYGAEEITCTTFRKTSALDLIQKVQESTGEESVKDHVGTMHSICRRLTGSGAVIEAKHIRAFAKEYKYEPYMRNAVTTAATDDESAYSGKMLDVYTWLRNTQTPIEKFYRYPGIDNMTMPVEKVPDFIKDYEQYKYKNGLVDFSDMLENVLINKIPLDTPVLMVDEFQDLTKQQFDIFNMWAKECESVTIAGDPLQSIYGFWGGSPDYFRQWQGRELIRGESHRLLNPVWNLAKSVLKMERQFPPEVTAKEADYNPVSVIDWDQALPVHPGTELHLVRCNYQAGAIAMQIAQQGRVFGGVDGWNDAEISIFNAIHRARTGAQLMPADMLALVDNYPLKLFKYDKGKSAFVDFLNGYYIPTDADNSPYLKPELCNILKSGNPAAYMSNCGNLKFAKITNMLHRDTPISAYELRQCQILTIHGAKGLEADTVYLHTGIAPRINMSLVLPGEDSRAEARVWYVGVTRAKHWLYLIKDKGYNYPLQGVDA